jgi:hypothetical protein
MSYRLELLEILQASRNAIDIDADIQSCERQIGLMRARIKKINAAIEQEELKLFSLGVQKNKEHTKIINFSAMLSNTS